MSKRFHQTELAYEFIPAGSQDLDEIDAVIRQL